MKQVLSVLIIAMLALSCKKDTVANTPGYNVTVKGVVFNTVKVAGTQQLYWQPGIIFDHGINATGTAVVSWYFSGGSAPYHHAQTLNFNVTQNGTGYFEFSDYKVDYTEIADSVKIESFALTTGSYNVTVQN